MNSKERQQIRTIAKLLDDTIKEKQSFEDRLIYIRDWLGVLGDEENS